MTATNQNFEIWQGEDKTVTVDIFNAAGEPYGDTSGLTFYYRLSESKDDPTALISKSTGSGITNGVSIITIDYQSVNTEGLSPRPYYHECRAIDGSNKEDVLFIGAVTVRPSTTKTV